MNLLDMLSDTVLWGVYLVISIVFVYTIVRTGSIAFFRTKSTFLQSILRKDIDKQGGK